MTEFLKESNIQLLWDVIIDEGILLDKPPEFIERIKTIFLSNLAPFYEEERKSTPPNMQNLVLFNKKYISSILQIIRRLSQPQVKKQLVTAQEIQEERKNKFERDLQKKRQDFDMAFTRAIPPEPTFHEKGEEEKPPVSELEKLIQQTLAERNYDIEPRGYSEEQAKNWLNSQETSVKKEKSILNQRVFSKIRQTKQIQIKEPLEGDTIQAVELSEKHVRWNDANLEENFFMDSSLSKKSNDEIQELKKEMNGLYKKIDEMGETISSIMNFISSFTDVKEEGSSSV